MTDVMIRAFPRVHVTLSDMGRTTPRAFGGLGFSYLGEEIIWKLQESSGFELHGLDRLDSTAQRQVSRIAEVAETTVMRPLRIELVSCSQQHSGYGTKTALLLGLLAGIREFSKTTMSDADLVRLSKRGGASGVGLHAFFRGGVIWDGGHATESVEQLVPSSSRNGHSIPPLLARWDLPFSWRVFDIRHPGIGLAGVVEADFFLQNAPVPRCETLEVIGTLFHGVIPAVVCGDLAQLRLSLNHISSTGFKKREIEARGGSVESTLRELMAFEGIAAGMSSTGPMLYAIAAADNSRALDFIMDIGARRGIDVRGPYAPCNHGHVVRKEY